MSDAEEKRDKEPAEEEGLPTASFDESKGRALGQVGPYKLLSILGEGGFGIVYLAEQQKPVKRRVALKVIKPGMDSKRVIARFEAEEQALALFDHPNVAQVYEAGITKAGRPYFAMECVKGVPITEYCDREKLSIEERLQLFLQVCEGLQHAHQKGVIHRDIKPSNILVFVQEKKVIPKIIDFGVAKAISQPLTERTLFTEQGQLVGTPEYMSPEQAENSQDIDTRTDIYSLGALLYELLTGVLPFAAETLREGGFENIKHIIREEEPKTPSTRLSRLSEEESTKLAQRRRADLGTLRRKLHGDLDWITLKAMEKDRTRRYVSAAELAADIGHYLNSEPVLASPPSTVYRIRKFVRRNRALVTATVAVAAALLIGLMVSTVMYLRAESLRVQAEEAEKITQKQRELAEERAEAHRRALYFTHFATAQTAYRDGRMRRVREQLEQCDADLRGWEWYRLQHISDQARMTLRGHTIGPTCVAFSPDGKRIISGGYSTVKVWDAATGTELMTLSGHIGRVYSIAYSPDGRRIVSGGSDKTIKVWDAANGEELVILHGHEYGVRSVAFSPDGKRIVSGSNDKTIKVWDAANGEELVTLQGHEYVLSAAFSPDGTRIVSCGSDETIRVWDAANGDELMTLRGHRWAVWSVSFSPDSKRIVSGGADNTIKVWNAETGAEVMTLRGHDDEVYGTTFSPDGQRIVSGSNDKTVKVWDVASGEELMTLRGHEGWVWPVAFSPDGLRIVSGSGDCTIKVWNAASDPEAMNLRGHKECVWPIAFSSDGERIVSGSNDKTIKVWDTASGAELMTIHGHKKQVFSTVFSPDGRRIASGSVDKTVKLWDAASGVELKTLRGHDNLVHSIVFSPDGKRIISCGLDQTIKIWDAATGSEVMTLRGHSADVFSVAVSRDGKRIVSGSEDKTIKVWDATTGAELMTLRGHEYQVTRVSISPDGNRILSASGDTVKVWDATTGAELMTLGGHEGAVHGIAFSPDCKRILSGSTANRVKVWDAGTGTEVMTLRGSSTVTTIEFSPDGRTVAISGSDGSIRLWESAAPAGGYGPRQTAEAAGKFIEQLYEKHNYYYEVIDKLQADRTLSEAVREVALQIANARRWEDAEKLSKESWEVVSLSGGDDEAYGLALGKAETANHLEPGNWSILNTLGVAQYRVGAYEDAHTTLRNIDKMRADTDEEPDPGCAAFIAMALYHLDRTKEAQAALGQLRGLFEDGRFDGNEEAQGLLFEAEKLLAGGNNKILSVWECIEGKKVEEAVQQVEELRSLQDAEIAGCMEGAVKWLGRAYYNRAKRRWRIGGEWAEMIADYEAVVRIDPDHARAFNKLAWLRVVYPTAEFQDAAKAVEEATKACELTKWQNSSYLSTLAVAYSEVGDFASAVKGQKEAIALLPEDERGKWQVNYEMRLKQYESGKPYHKKGQLAGWWKFDDGSGTEVNDSSGNRYSGRLNNMDASSWVDGVTGRGLEFDGDDDYVSIPALCLYSDTLAISAWIKRDGQQDIYTGIVYCRDGSTTAGISFGGTAALEVNHELAYAWNDSPATWGWHSGLIVPDNEWVLVAVVVEPTKATLYLGENGKLSSATNEIKHHIEEFDGITRIGSDPLINTRYFKGLIDDVRIYSYALSEAEIKALCAGKEPNPAED